MLKVDFYFDTSDFVRGQTENIKPDNKAVKCKKVVFSFVHRVVLINKSIFICIEQKHYKYFF